MPVTEIDRTAVSTASAIPGRRNPLEVLGVDTSAQTDTTSVLKTAGLLGWNVHLRPLETVLETVHTDAKGVPSSVENYGSRLQVPGGFATVRTSPHTGKPEVIGVVGDRYQVQQIETLESILTGLVEASGGQITHAADFYGTGRQVFFGVELPTSLMVGGRDLVDHVVTCFTSFDGSLSTTFAISSLRAMCANMRQQVLSASASAFTVRHTLSGPVRLAQAEQLLQLAWKKATDYGQKAELLIAKQMDDEVFSAVCKQVFGDKEIPASVKGQTMQSNRNLQLKQILHGPTNVNIAGTAWAGFQAVTEYLQYNATGKDAEKVERTNALRTIKTTGAIQSKIELAEKLFLTV